MIQQSMQLGRLKGPIDQVQRVGVMTSRPGRVATEIGIDTVAPRTEDFRTSADYAGYCRKVTNALAPAYSGQSA